MNIVLGLGYAYYQYSLNLFNKGSSQSTVQQNIRIAVSSISNEVRFATELEILSATTSIPQDGTINDDNNYIFVDSSDGIIKHRDNTGTVNIPTALSNGLKFSLNFKPDSSAKVLYFEVTDTNNTYNIETNVVILNLQTNTIIGVPDGVAIRYKTTVSPTTTPAINSVVLNPTFHMTGNSQNITVAVTTCNVSDGTNLSAEFVDSNGNSLSPAITASGTITSNTCNLTLANVNKPVGDYMVKVIVNGISYPRYVIYKITTSLVIDTTDPPAGTVGQDFSDNNYSFSVQGGTQPYTFSITSGTFPPGLILASNGAVSGTPSTANTYDFTITVNDSAPTPETSSYPYTITINPFVYVTSIIVTAPLTQIGKHDTLQMSYTVSPSNATNQSVTWTVTGVSGVTITTGGLLDPNNNTGTATVKATAKDGSGVFGTKNITINNH